MPKVQSVQPFTHLDSKKCYLLLISPEKMPHLALVNRKGYYSLTHKKSIVGDYFDPYLAFFKRTKRRLLFLELVDIEESPASVFGEYTKVDTSKTTCLTPVKKVVLSKSEADFVYELIPELYKENRIANAYQLNMDDLLDELGDFNLVEYPKSAIFDYIKSLNEKHAKR